jgi:hypothetical protein
VDFEALHTVAYLVPFDSLYAERTRIERECGWVPEVAGELSDGGGDLWLQGFARPDLSVETEPPGQPDLIGFVVGSDRVEVHRQTYRQLGWQPAFEAELSDEGSRCFFWQSPRLRALIEAMNALRPASDPLPALAPYSEFKPASAPERVPTG